MKISKILTTAAALLLTGAVSAQNQEMDKFVDGLGLSHSDKPLFAL